MVRSFHLALLSTLLASTGAFVPTASVTVTSYLHFTTSSSSSSSIEKKTQHFMVAQPIFSNATEFANSNGAKDPTGVAVADALNKVRTVSVEHGRGDWNSYGTDPKSFNKLGMYQIKCFNKISSIGLGRFDESKYDVRLEGQGAENAHAILLRSHKLQESDVPKTCRAIARAGAGVNNIPVERMTELGIPVFNTPGGKRPMGRSRNTPSHLCLTPCL